MVRVRIILLLGLCCILKRFSINKFSINWANQSNEKKKSILKY